MHRISLTFLFTLLFLSTFAQLDIEQNVALDYVDTPISKVLQNLEDTYQIQFSYGNIDLSNKINIKFEGKLNNALQLIFEEQAISYKVFDQQIALKKTRTKVSETSSSSIKGKVIDIDSKQPLIGANIIVVNSDPLIGTTTDIDGYFKFPELPLGRYDLNVSYLGYEQQTIPQILVTAGKEVFLTIEIKESIVEVEEVVITAKANKSKPLNDMASLSARSFSVEESSRYAASLSDPARMAQSYAGVSSGGDDLSNEIIVRGNSAKGILWRLEGVEIPNPNHYGSMGSGGGAISMLSSNVLSNSDFYSGAFPAEFGNALSGVFDLKFRNGNSEKRENSIVIGLLGLEFATEGYFSKKSRASYLFNYRYSTLGLMDKILPTIQQDGVNYQDLSFKINVPTKKAGTFSIFGLGGINSDEDFAEKDSTTWIEYDDRFNFEEKQRIGVVGLKHIISVNEKTFLKSVVVGSVDFFEDKTNFYYFDDGYKDTITDQSHFENFIFTGSFTLNHKFNPKHTLRTGLILSHKIYQYDYITLEAVGWQPFFNNKGNTQVLQSFAQWKFRFHKNWTLNSGAHFTYLALNNTWALDPRAALQWQFKPNQSLGLAVGVHSKPEHISTYFIERIGTDGEITTPNKPLQLQNAFHIVGSYDLSFANNFRLKLEAYYQYLYNIPISINPTSEFSILNASNVWGVIFQNDEDGSQLVSEGTGRNFGIDITLEKFFSNQYYFLVTTSIFDSKYRAPNGNLYNTRYANNFLLNVLGGKEFSVGKNKKNLFGLNGKFTIYGGNRDTPIDLEASQEAGYGIEISGQKYANKTPVYYRFDVGIKYIKNAKKATHTIAFDVQNLTNRYNIYQTYYDSFSESIVNAEQNGAIPVFSYKVQFSFDKKN